MTTQTSACSAGGGSLRPPDLEELQERLGYRFADCELLSSALMHRSRVHEDGGSGHGNERLEFLGDAVLDLLVSELLMEAHPESDEGRLSRARAAAVNTDALAERARDLDLGGFVQLGRGERRSGGAEKASILANVFEALLGAIYLDGGLGPVRALVERDFGAELRAPDAGGRDAKTLLQEELQRRGQPAPHYEMLRESGPDHRKQFSVEVRADREVLGSGLGGSKRAAEQAAAGEALARIRGESAQREL
jgi:ribonuclease-3